MLKVLADAFELTVKAWEAHQMPDCNDDDKAIEAASALQDAIAELAAKLPANSYGDIAVKSRIASHLRTFEAHEQADAIDRSVETDARRLAGKNDRMPLAA